MRSFEEIKKDMKYPSPEVKTICMHEVARYLRDTCKCGFYSETLKKLSRSKYYFGVNSDELMELLSNKYNCKEICDKTKLLIELYKGIVGITASAEAEFSIDADLIYKFVCEHIVEKKFDYNNLTCEDIDDFVEGIETLKLPGVLYPLMWITHADNEKVFLYIYTKYVLPAFIELSISGDIDRYEALRLAMRDYIHELIIYVQGIGEVFITSIPRYTTWNEVVVSFQKSGEFECIRRANEKLKSANGIGMLLLELHKRNRKWLKNKHQMLGDYYPIFAALIIFALLGEGRDKEAVEFMIDNYSDISEDSYQCAYVLILLFRTILLADNYEYMNILYADLQKEKLLYQRNYRDIHEVMMQSCELIEEIYEKMRKPLEMKGSDIFRRYVKETVFEDWGLIEDIRNIRSQYARSQDKIKSDMFRRMYDIMKALSDSEGINVKLIGQIYGKNYRDSELVKDMPLDDKIPTVISWDDADRAERLFARIGDVNRGATSIRNRMLFERVDIVIKDILLEKLDEDIESMLLSIKELREKDNYLDKEDEFFTLVGPRIESLANRISAKYIDRDQIINYFISLDDKGCWDRLDNECKNMMITSEIVYRTLVARKDADDFDYSPSMIPLTKVLEYLLNEIYSKIRCNIVFEGPKANLDSYSTKYFIDNREKEPKKCLEMGPAISMLSDGFLKFGNGGLVYRNYFLEDPIKYRFSEWKGDSYVDWSLLKDFNGTKLKCNSFYPDSPIAQFTLGNDVEYNRRIFIGALEYIKNNYRNKVAHKDGIERPRMEKCREDMLITQKLIWMLVYIIK